MISRRNTIIAPSYSKCTVQATNALWFGEVQASVEKCKCPGCSCSVVIRSIQIHARNQQTWRTLAMHSWPLSNEALMSHEIVSGDGISIFGGPAVKSS